MHAFHRASVAIVAFLGGNGGLMFKALPEVLFGRLV